MIAKKIKDDDIADMKIASLPTKPTTPTLYGGKGYTAKEIKEAFDKLPLYIIERYNELIDDIEALGEDSLAGSIKTGITETHTLAELFNDIKEGTLCAHVGFSDVTLAEYLLTLRQDVDFIKNHLRL